MADFHEAAWLDCEQADQEVNYTHTQTMLQLEIQKEKMHQKYELETLNVQAQLHQQSQQPPANLRWLVDLMLDVGCIYIEMHHSFVFR